VAFKGHYNGLLRMTRRGQNRRDLYVAAAGEAITEIVIAAGLCYDSGNDHFICPDRSSPMNVSLTPELENLVTTKVKSGMYHSASEVIRAGLRLLQEQDELRTLRLEDLRREIAKGVEQANRGELLDGEEVLAGLHQRIDEMAATVAGAK